MTVVFVAAGVDRRHPALRLLPEAALVELRPPAGRALPSWLRERARAVGLDLAPAAAQALPDLVGEDLGRLAGEIEKLALYAGGEGRIGEAEVRALAGETRAHRYWQLTQALEEGQRAEALRVLDRLLAAGEDPLGVLTGIMGYLRNLGRAAEAFADTRDFDQTGRRLKPPRPGWAAERVVARAARLGPAGLAAALDRGFETESALKSGATTPAGLLTDLVAGLAR